MNFFELSHTTKKKKPQGQLFWPLDSFLAYATNGLGGCSTTVWKFEGFSARQILREIDFVEKLIKS